jgi:hypothetical protein
MSRTRARHRTRVLRSWAQTVEGRGFDLLMVSELEER